MLKIPDHIDRNDWEALADWGESAEFERAVDPADFEDVTPEQTADLARRFEVR